MRLGSGDKDAGELKDHVFFASATPPMDWEGLLNGRIAPPWRPTVVGSIDTSQFDQEFTSMQPVGKSY
jgi:hypothetical protein